jgi:hypothetical protein
MSDEYTPTTEEVMRGFTALQYKINPRRDDEDLAGWLSRMSKEVMTQQMLEEAAARRWLAKHDAAVWQEGVTDAIWNAEHPTQPPISNPYRKDMK